MPTSFRFTLLNAVALAPLSFLSPSVAAAQTTQQRFELNIPAQPVSDALRVLGSVSHASIIVDSDLAGEARSQELKGSFTVQEALTRLLAGSRLGFTRVGEAWVVRATSSQGDDITVTGSRVRGALPTSIVVKTDRTQIENSGQTTVREFIASIPQNSGGGQNPGQGSGIPSANGIDVGGAATINLRGLGSDATLTLVNGHRLAYNASRQGIDVSALPLGIVDHVEVVADGASAIYGSDAVAGVANIILRRDFRGLETTANIGDSTDGGGFRQQYGAVAGTTWNSGGVVLAYEHASSTRIMSDQRDYASGRPGVLLFPEQVRNALALAGHQRVTDNLTFEIDALFNKRRSTRVSAYNSAGDLSLSSFEASSISRSLEIAPLLKLDIGSGWQAQLAGTYGRERVHTSNEIYSGTTMTAQSRFCYCNAGQSVELSGDGPLFALPGGAARLALGAGYRNNDFQLRYTPGRATDVKARQDSYYGYAELSLPVVSPQQNIPGIDRLNFSGAVRFERYPTIDSVFTPKLGAVWSPLADVSIKGSWGKSFKAPTLYQRYSAQYAELYNATSLGGTSGTALFWSGGNPDIKPEHATTWSATLEYQPSRLPGLDIQLSYFSVVYRNKIIEPISYFSQTLSNAAYAMFVTSLPTADQLATAIASSTFYNYTSGSYDPANVVALVDDRSANVGRQTIRGIDALATYRTEVGDKSFLSFDLNASYLKSEQQLTPGSAVTQMAGTLYYPPHWRGRAGVTWSSEGATFNATVSRIGSVRDERQTTPVTVHGMTTLDLTGRYAFAQDRGPLAGLALTLTAQNVLNDKPDTIYTSAYNQTPYDTTNYSPTGRYLGVGISKSW